MFEFDAGKLLVIGIVALIVIGPKELPRVMRQVGHAVGKLRRLGAEFQAQFMEAMREADAESMKAEISEAAQSAKVDVGSDPLAEIRSELMTALEERSHPASPVQLPAPDHAPATASDTTRTAEAVPEKVLPVEAVPPAVND